MRQLLISETVVGWDKDLLYYGVDCRNNKCEDRALMWSLSRSEA